MSRRRKDSLDEEARKGAEKIKKLLENPEEFERWANETLDKSRMRKR